jgi:hypothetical protein
MALRFLTGALLAVLTVSLVHGQDNSATPSAMPTLRITSPMGRTGAPATVRIVAQVQWPAEGGGHVRPLHFRFLVDGAVVGTVDSGPPYAVTWLDENPFESREIVVEAEDDGGNVIRDKVTLPAYEIADETEVASILVDAVVYDGSGRAVSNLDKAEFTVRENGDPQTLDLFTKETLPSTVALLVDSSQSMSQRMPAVRQAAELLARNLGKRD